MATNLELTFKKENKMEQYREVLKKCALFKDIYNQDLNSLLSCLDSHTKIYKNDEYVFLAGDKIQHVGIVLEGALEILKENPAGNKHLIAFLGPSHIFAEGIVCTINRISPVSIRVKKNSVVLFIPYEKITKNCAHMCTYHNSLVKNMMMILGEKNFNLNTKLELLMMKGMREKLAAFLLTEYNNNQSLTFQIIPNRNELAEYLNVSRTSMCRELGRMKAENLIDYYQNSFKIQSLEKLKKSVFQ